MGYRIVVNMGDQPSDLAGGYAEKAVLLPNPFYRIPWNSAAGFAALTEPAAQAVLPYVPAETDSEKT